MKVSSVLNTRPNSTASLQNSASFGYGFFLKDVNLPCAYCGEQMLSVANLKRLAKVLEKKKGQDAVKLLHQNYEVLDTRSKSVVDVLCSGLLANKKEPVREVVANLSKASEGKTNCEYKEALIYAYAKSEIQKTSPLGKKLANLIEESKEKLFHTKPNSSQKTLRITYLQNGIQNLINGTKRQDEKIQLKRFLTTINKSFDKIKQDPSTFFPKFGEEPVQSFLGSLFAPIRTTADHIVLASKNGACEDANYIAVCGRCNWARSEQGFKAFVKSHPKVIPNIKKQFAFLDAMLSPQFPKPNHAPSDLPDNIFKYLMGVQETIKEQLGEPLKMDLPFFKERAAKLFELKQ